jgi:uncharacterized protein YvpB
VSRRSLAFATAALTVLASGVLRPPVAVRAASAGYIPSAPRIQQIRGLACEAAALQIALAAKGINVSQDWLLAQMGADLRPPVLGGDGYPIRWGNPYDTFVGNVNGAMGRDGYGVYQPPVIEAARAAGATAWGGDGMNPADLYEQVAAGNPVVVWVSWSLEPPVLRTMQTWDGHDVWFSRQEHAQTLIGFDYGRGTVTLSDPLTGSYRTFGMGLFQTRFAQFHSQAVVVARQWPLPAQSAGSTSRIAVRGADDQLWAGGASTGWGAEGGRLLAAPAIVRRPGGTPVYVATGTDHQLWVRDDAESWALLSHAGVYCSDAPAAALRGSTLIVGCQGRDGGLWVTATGLTPGALPVAGNFTAMGLQLWDGPAIAVIGGVVTYVANDAGGHVWTRTDSTGWTATAYWCIGHAAVAVSAGSVLFACHGSDEQGWYGIAPGAFPSVAIPLAGHLIDGVGAAPSGAGFEVDATGTDLEAWYTHIEGTGWTGWQPLGGRIIGGAAAA